MAARTNIYNNVNIRGTLSMRNFQFPSNDGNAGQVMVTDGIGQLSWASVSGGTGSTSPAGSDGYIQYNDSGSFGADSNLYYNIGGDSEFGAIYENGSLTGTVRTGAVTILSPFLGISGATMTYNSGSSENYAIGVGTNGLGNLAIMGEFDTMTASTFLQIGGNRAQLTSTSGNTNTNISLDKNNAAMTSTNGVSGSTAVGVVYSAASVVFQGSSPVKEFYVTDGLSCQFLVDSTGAVCINSAFGFPKTDGTAGQVLTTNGSGSVIWSATTGGSASIVIDGAGNCSTVRDDASNTSSGSYSTAFGFNNAASGNCSTVAGGQGNVARVQNSTVGGGCNNLASGSTSTVSGGYNNKAGTQFSFIGGGSNNVANGTVGGVSTVSGGYLNRALVDYSFIGGGRRNTNSSYCGVIGGGSCNTLTGNCSTIVGGTNNCVYGTHSGILGGDNNAVTGGSTTFIVGDGITADRTCTTFVNNLSIMNIPTGDPGIAGAVWSDSGTLKISSGGGP